MTLIFVFSYNYVTQNGCQLKFLCITLEIAWRPYGGMSPQQNAFLLKCVNTIYPVMIISLLLFSYVASAVACRGEIKKSSMNSTIPASKSPVHFASSNMTNLNRSKQIVKESDDDEYDEPWEPAYKECRHVFGTFVLPSLLHLTAYLIGFYLYRIRQHEGLYFLMEKVFLQSSKQKHVEVTLSSWCFLILGMVWLVLEMGIFVFFILAFGPETVTGFRHNRLRLTLAALLMCAGQLVSELVNVVIIVNYAAQCQLIIHYIRGVTRRIEEKSADLQSIMKDILEIKNAVERMNSLLSFMVSLCVFTLLENCLINSIYLFVDEDKHSVEVILYRTIDVIVKSLAIFFPVIQAARVTGIASQFKQISLDVRVFGHQTSSQLELDSFLNFVQSAHLKAYLFLTPVRGSLLCGLTMILVITILFLMHTGQIATQTKFF
ncbi:uncharacterized protein LOC124446188 isoform X2 [Xenia sp. Carnegie-2017]|uniref:uncharacterized protein LOC124446188 isoform X2 n=1 Tax=Xenia sp. Carnegie-2017 TaxID=2897299 RepID=UPI001F0336B6|nr:uncharacterized protein LOC124446188 isoform X2 [Xenia sp. Carnegie-2017]